MRILIVKTSSLGDIVHAFPVVEWLRARFPHAKIDWVAEKAGAALLHAHSGIDNVLTIDTKRWRRNIFRVATWKEILLCLRTLRLTKYDVLFDLQGNTKSGFFTKCAHAQTKVGFGRSNVREWPNLLVTNRKIQCPIGINIRETNLFLCRSFYGQEENNVAFARSLRLTKEEEERKKQILSKFSEGAILMICPGSRWENKRLHDTSWIEFLRGIRQNTNMQFCLIYSGDEEKERIKKIASSFPSSSVIVGDLTLPLWQGLMAEVQGVIAVDSVGLHLAATSGAPTFSVFGPSSADVYAPQGILHTSVQGKCPYNQNFRIRCPKLRDCPTGACIKDISSDTLIARFQEWWSAVQSRCAFPLK